MLLNPCFDHLFEIMFISIYRRKNRAMKILPNNLMSASDLWSLVELDQQTIAKYIEHFELVIPDFAGFKSVYVCIITEYFEVN